MKKLISILFLAFASFFFNGFLSNQAIAQETITFCNPGYFGMCVPGGPGGFDCDYSDFVPDHDCGGTHEQQV